MDHVYAITHVVGSSASSIEDAVKTAIRAASKSLRNLEWFEITEVRGHIANDDVGHYQVVLKVGFRYEDGGSSHP